MAADKLLIIDELGFVPLAKTGADLLFEMISQCLEGGATLITSNQPFDEWAETFGTERLTGALLDWLTPAQKFDQADLIIANLKSRLIGQTVTDERVFPDIDSDCTVHLPFHPCASHAGLSPGYPFRPHEKAGVIRLLHGPA